MKLLEIATIEIRPRIRTIDQNNVNQLEESFTSPKGMLHPIIIGSDEKGTFLVAGEHRLLAAAECHKKRREFTHGGELVPPGLIPTTHLSDLSPADLLETELEENIIRAEVPWQDRTKALAAIHSLRVAVNPKQTLMDTAREIQAKGGKEVKGDSGGARAAIRNATILAANLHRPSVAKARNATEAMGILLKEEEAKVEAELIKRRQAKVESSTVPLISVIHGSLFDHLEQMADGEVDLICTDPPYGIDADKGGFRQRTVEHHNYVDDRDTALKIMQEIITQGFRITKPRANLFMFGDIDYFQTFKEMCGRMGWKPFRTPVTWQKSESEGLAPWGKEGFRRTCEWIFFATKGERGLIMSPVDILRENRVSRALRRYGPEKPVGLLKQLIECSTMPGDLVLDPCCGSGTTLAACRELKRRAIGIEIDEGAYNMSVVAANRDIAGDAKLEELV